MKDKEKQIEEMQKKLCTTDCQECMSEYLDFLKEHNLCGDSATELKKRCIFHEQAEKLYNAGYRKLPEDSVVLSREELNEIIKQTKETEKNYYKKVVIPQERKETAEGIINFLEENRDKYEMWYLIGELKKYFGLFSNEQGNAWCYGDMADEIAKQFGVEIKE